MTPDQLVRIWSPFSQAESGTARKFGGSGLGLAISRRFCEVMQGDIRVESTFGEGSTFIVEIPAIVRLVEAPMDSMPESLLVS